MAIACFSSSMLLHQLSLGAQLENCDIPIKIPPNLENCNIPIKNSSNFEEFDEKEYPHWAVFECIHMGKAFSQTALICQAKIISEIPEDKILTLTVKDLLNLGLDLNGGDWD